MSSFLIAAGGGSVGVKGIQSFLVIELYFDSSSFTYIECSRRSLRTEYDLSSIPMTT